MIGTPPPSGRRVARINPSQDWILKDVPELAIASSELWQAVKTRQGQIAIDYAGVIEAVQKSNKLNRTNRPKSLLSGLVHCGVCGGPYTLRGQGRFACSRHVDTRSCGNSHTISRTALEDRVLAGLKDRRMAPDLLAEAIRAYVDETNRLNHERRASSAAAQTELKKIDRAVSGILDAIEDGRRTSALMERLYDLEDRKAALQTQMAEAPTDTPTSIPKSPTSIAGKSADWPKHSTIPPIVMKPRTH